MTNAIEVKGLSKTYRKGFRRQRVEALRGIDLQVRVGETFGFLGPNGAGKTTAIRILMGLIGKGSGVAKIFGHEIPSRSARERLGFLPEAPYFYDYLSVSELLDFTGRLFGQSAKERSKRSDKLIELVNLKHAAKSKLKSYSKGMMQRAGIAQALMNDPELVVFDEPMSGLDPIGRKDVRDIILSLKAAKKTVFFSSHILSDVESVVDRIAILVQGEVVDQGKLSEVVSSQRGTEVILSVASVPKQDREKIANGAEGVRYHDETLIALLDVGSDIDTFVRTAQGHGAKLVSVTPVNETLEDVFVRSVKKVDTAEKGESK